MDFSKLSDSQLTEFLLLYYNVLPVTVPEKIRLANDIYIKFGPQGKYTIPVVDLYLASQIISPNNTRKYDYQELIHIDLDQLLPLFELFSLAATEENRFRLLNILRLGNAVTSQWSDLPIEVQKIIFNKISDEYLLNICPISSDFLNICSDEDFWHNRFLTYFPNEFVNDRYSHLTWKNTYYMYGFGNSTKVLVYDRNLQPISEIRIFNNETFEELVHDMRLGTKICFLDQDGDGAIILFRDSLGKIVASKMETFSGATLQETYRSFNFSRLIRPNITTMVDHKPIPNIHKIIAVYLY